MNMGIHAQTPNLSVIDNRGLAVRQIAYWREDAGTPEARITARCHDAAGRLVAQRDPRLFADASAPANLATVYSLSGQVLSTLSVDAGWRVNLCGETRQPLHGWDGRYSQRRIEYDQQLRPLAVFEHARDGEPLCTERYGYGGSDPTFATRNQCGQLIRHDDPAGTQLFEQFGLTGGVVQQTRHFLHSLDVPDWPGPLPDRDALLEPGAGATSRSVFNTLGETIEQTDAKGHRQFFAQNLAGQLREVRLQLDKQPQSKTLVNAIQYNAQGQAEQETAGNDVITALHYAPEDGRLTRLHARRNNDILQDLRYAYDPVGNVISIEDAALPIRYFANQRIEPINRYGYDSLYQLVKATGWEAGSTSQGPLWSSFNDPAAVTRYTQTYHYDRGGNLLELSHEGAQQHGHRLLAAARSNRCLPVLNGVEPDEEDFRNGFDANGNLLALQPGQSLHWDLRNQLREVRPVERDDAADDNERYVYGADDMRLRKLCQTQANARMLIAEVRYLPNLQIRTHIGTGETLQVISVQAGRSSVQVLHWESEPPNDIDNDQLRYSLSDHLGSCTLELDSAGQVISHERYHPFGTTAWFAGRGEVEASYKTLRYSGKERDATGLYYYGFRYYVAWLQRWLNPDPAKDIDGLNHYRFVRNNPILWVDAEGLAPVTLLYGFEHVRSRVLNGLATASPQQSFVRIDEINDALQINMENASSDFEGFNEMIREGIEVEDDNVDYFMQATPSYQGTPAQARNLLQGWSDYLKSHSAAFDITRKIQSYEKTSTKEVEQFWKKNLREPLSEHEVQNATLALQDSSEALFSLRTASSIKAGDAVINWQFRQFSKLALDWMAGTSETGDDSGVVFLDVIARSPDFVFKEFAQETFTTKPYKEAGAVYGKSYNPITHSERRHLQTHMAVSDSSYVKRVHMIGLDQARHLSNA
ncbi:RHS repeat domain-containing protein [Pseudomonas neuropathica]|uniref:RHS repeat domain-containing protein n=1 Tax=Pseudomonas neuropathica TaxID=2730425 RepID=UPI001E43FF79|nr:RHS repeat-associated core domain-containing protein [Pseudomonas neuropathica]